MDSPASLNGWGDPIKPDFDDTPDTPENTGTQEQTPDPVKQEKPKEEPKAETDEEEMIPLPDELKELVNEPDAKKQEPEDINKVINPDGKTPIEQQIKNLQEIYGKQSNELGELRKKAEQAETAAAILVRDDKGNIQGLDFDQIIKIAGGAEPFGKFLRDNYGTVLGLNGFQADPRFAGVANFKSPEEFLENLSKTDPDKHDELITDPKAVAKLSAEWAQYQVSKKEQEIASERTATRIQSAMQQAPSKYKDWDTLKHSVGTITAEIAPLMSPTSDPTAVLDIAVRLAREKDSGNRATKIFNEGYKRGRMETAKAKGAAGKVTGEHAPKQDDEPQHDERIEVARRDWGL